jgi:hypothetical protein
MKKSSYCGAEYGDGAVECVIGHTLLDQPGAQPPSPPHEPHSESKPPGFEFEALSEADRQKDLATLMKCGTLTEADLIVSRLRAAGIDAFLPDETLMQTIAWNLNTYGYVRVQVAPKDYDAARELLSGDDDAE